MDLSYLTDQKLSYLVVVGGPAGGRRVSERLVLQVLPLNSIKRLGIAFEMFGLLAGEGGRRSDAPSPAQTFQKYL